MEQHPEAEMTSRFSDFFETNGSGDDDGDFSGFPSSLLNLYYFNLTESHIFSCASFISSKRDTRACMIPCMICSSIFYLYLCVQFVFITEKSAVQVPMVATSGG